MIKIVNTTEEYEGHDKYIYLELEKTGKTLLLNYGGYTNIEYNRESNEITFDLDAFKDFIDNLLEEKKKGIGCQQSMTDMQTAILFGICGNILNVDVMWKV